MVQRDTKTAILEAAIALMGRAGVDGFSASALAKEVGISKATLFHHFNALDEIPVAALDLMSAQAMQFDLPENAGLADVLAAIGDVSFEILQSQRGFLNGYFAFYSKAMFDPRLRAKMQVSLRMAKAQMAELLGPYLPDGEDASVLADMVMTTLDGAMMHALLLQNDAEVRAVWLRCVRMLLREFAHEDRD